VNFYVGENALAHQKRTTALARFHAVQSSCIKDYVEYGGALADLKHAMGAPATPAKPATAPTDMKHTASVLAKAATTPVNVLAGPVDEHDNGKETEAK